MKIALCQMNIKAGDPDANFAKILSMIERAKSNEADIVVLPELCVSGYLLGDKFTEDKYCNWLESFNVKLKEASKDTVLIYGNIICDKNSKNQDGRMRKYNSAVIFQNGKEVFSINGRSYQPKTLLPNYRFFDDERYFSSNLDDTNIPIEEKFLPFCINIHGKEYKIGLEVCEDLWAQDYNINPTKELIRKGAELIINISASPWTYGKHIARDNAINRTFKDVEKDGLNTVPFYYVNNVGVQNNGKNFITFDGGTTAYGSDGKPRVISSKMYEEEIIYVEHDIVNEKPIIERKIGNKIEEKYLAIKQGLKHFPIGQEWVIGLSGGIDSSLVACLLVDVFGASNVTGINMPTKFNSNKTKKAAKTVADKLGIKYLEIPIEGILEENKKILNGMGAVSDLTLENMQARIRSSCILSTVASHKGALYTSNGNKLEVALGYATLYGDINGAVSPIADLTKTEVVQMCRWINEKRNIFPEELLPDDMFRFADWQIKPSAELKNEQIDPMLFGYHCSILEKIMDYKKISANDIMEWYISGKLHIELGIEIDLLKRYNLFDPIVFLSDLKWFFVNFRKNVFKRVQSPPVIVLSKTAFGYDLRESMLPYTETEEFEHKLCEKITKLKSYSPI